jgi:hypothetical protein
MQQSVQQLISFIHRISPRLLTVWLFVYGALAVAQKYIWATSNSAELGGFERNVIYGILQLLDTGVLYQNPEQPPHSLIQYNPLFYQLVAVIVRLLDIDFQADVHQVYTVGRSVNLILTLLSTGLLYLLLKIFSVRNNLSIGLALLWLALAAQGFISARPDTLKHLFFVATVWFAVLYGKSEKLKWLVWSLVSALLAFLTKQDGLIAFGIPLGLLFIYGEWRRLLFAIPISGLATVLSVLIINHFSNGFFLANVVGGLKNGISLSWFYGTFSGYFIASVWVFAPGLWYAVNHLAFNKCRTAIALGILISFVLPLVFALKYGSAPNYFNECMLLCFVPLGIIIQQLQESNLLPNKGHLLCLIGVVLITFMPMYASITGVFLNHEKQLKSDRLVQQNVSAWVNKNLKSDEYVLCLIQKQWEDHLTNYLFQKSVIPQRDVWKQVYDANKTGGFDYLKQTFEGGKVKFIISRDKNLPNTFMGVSLTRFVMKEELGGYTIFEYQP